MKICKLCNGTTDDAGIYSKETPDESFEPTKDEHDTMCYLCGNPNGFPQNRNLHFNDLSVGDFFNLPTTVCPTAIYKKINHNFARCIRSKRLYCLDNKQVAFVSPTKELESK